MSLVSNQKRFLELLALGAEHDVSFLLDRVGLSSLVPERYRGLEPGTAMPDAERLRRLFEVLGPTFVKMGQILSTRPDLVPGAFIAELKKLQDNVGTVPFGEMRPIVESELGAPIGEVFGAFDENALAAASIGQVYRATLKDGTAVVVKVQRPAIEDTIRTDVALLRTLAQIVQASGRLGAVDLVAIIREFERSILRELDYVVEGRNTDKFRVQHAANEQIFIPKVHWDYTRKRVLTLDLVDGIKVSEIDRLRQSGQDLKQIARTLTHTVTSQVLLLDRFHADPHPGNLLVLSDGRLGMIDFGMSGGFDRPLRRALAQLLQDIRARDAERLTDHLLQAGFLDYDADIRAIQKDARAMFRTVDSSGVHAATELFIQFVVRHKLDFPPDLFFLDKVFGTLDGTVRTLDPEAKMEGLAKELMPELAASLVSSPGEMVRQLVSRLVGAEDEIVAIPASAHRVLQRLDAGHLKLVMRQVPSESAVRARSRQIAAGGVMGMGALWTAAGLWDAQPAMALAVGLVLFSIGVLVLWFQGGEP